MSRPRYWWDGTVRKAMRLYYTTAIDRKTVQGQLIYSAITTALEETEKRIDGAERIKLMNLCYFKNSMNIDQGAFYVYVSPRTAQQWIMDFVQRVGQLCGYK